MMFFVLFTRESRSIETNRSNSKRPLEALSLRQPKNVQNNEQKKLPYAQENNIEDWSDDFDFKVDRWQRSSEKEINISKDQDKDRFGSSKSRNIPRSRRRRV